MAAVVARVGRDDAALLCRRAVPAKRDAVQPYVWGEVPLHGLLPFQAGAAQAGAVDGHVSGLWEARGEAMSTSDMIAILLVSLLALFLWSVFCHAIGKQEREDELMDEAVEQGAGEYYLDEKH